MTEEAVVNLFFTFRVFLVGGILLALPRISRKGLVFGTYFGEEHADGAAVARLRRSWDIGCALVMVVSLLVGWTISLRGEPIRGNLTATAVLLITSPLLYVWMYRKARRLAPPDAVRQAARSAASLNPDESRGDGFAKFSVAACILVARAKRSVRGGAGGRSAAAQDAFRAANAHVFSGTALFLCLLLTVLSLEFITFARARAAFSLRLAVGLIAGAMVVYMAASLLRIMRRFGQGGSRLETGSVDAPLTGGLVDNAHWILGMIYVDKNDPALLVESRFGIGYTFNLGKL